MQLSRGVEFNRVMQLSMYAIRPSNLFHMICVSREINLRCFGGRFRNFR